MSLPFDGDIAMDVLLRKERRKLASAIAEVKDDVEYREAYEMVQTLESDMLDQMPDNIPSWVAKGVMVQLYMETPTMLENIARRRED